MSGVCVCFVFFFSNLDNEFHDHLLRDNKCESINQGGQCGSGILSSRALGKLQSKVNNLKGTDGSLNSAYRLKITFVRDKQSLGINDCITVFWISSTLSGGVSLLL